MIDTKNAVEHISNNMMCNASIDTILADINGLKSLDIRDRDGRTLLINAVLYGDVNVINFLLQRKMDANITDKRGMSALHAAVQRNNCEIVMLLLQHGANPNIQNTFGNTPLWMAHPTGSREILIQLLEHGADPTIKNNYGHSAVDGFAAFPEILALFASHKKRTG